MTGIFVKKKLIFVPECLCVLKSIEKAFIFFLCNALGCDIKIIRHCFY